MLRATETSSQLAANMPLPRQFGRSEPDGVEDAVEAVPSLRPGAFPAACELLGRGDVDFQHIGLASGASGRSVLVRESARPAP